LKTLPFASALTIAAAVAFAQPKISPRIERQGGSVYVVVFRPGADMALARERMRANGFDLIEHPDLRVRDVLAAGPRGRVGQLGEWDEVAYVLPASPALAAGQPVIACAGPLSEEGEAGEYAEVGRGWPRAAGRMAELRYVFESVTAKIEQGAARAEVERALREWEKYGNLTFTPASDAGGLRTIAISFVHGAHGDSYPFDGVGRGLAHTFYPAPPNPEPIAGNMHFDAAEDWRIGAGIDLYSVALHEVGHALGLGHSDRPGAVMYPYYHQAYGLTSDDIAGIRDLYGAKETAATPPSPEGPPAPPVEPPVPPPVPPTPPPAAGDKTPPSLRIASPWRTMVTTTAASLTIAGSASDDRGVEAVRWTSSTGASEVAAGTANWSATVPLYVGTTVITVRAYDAAGNSAWRAITVTRR
jgi:hypothetical protein